MDKQSEIYAKKRWVEEYENYKEDTNTFDGLDTYSKLQYIWGLNFLIRETLEEVHLQKTNLVPWIKIFLPNNERASNFLAFITTLIES
jgi:hypothetical protein